MVSERLLRRYYGYQAVSAATFFQAVFFVYYGERAGLSLATILALQSFNTGLRAALDLPFGIGPLQFHTYFPEDTHNSYLNAFMSGGWLVCEEFDSLSMPADPVLHPEECALKAQAAMQRVMASHGANTRYGRDLAARMRALGLVDIRAQGQMTMWQGGSIGARLFRANFEQLREELLRVGLLTPTELDDDLTRLDDPRTLFPSPVMWTVCGRRPRGSQWPSMSGSVPID